MSDGRLREIIKKHVVAVAESKGVNIQNEKKTELGIQLSDALKASYGFLQTYSDFYKA